jgi:hypothetical protein
LLCALGWLCIHTLLLLGCADYGARRAER